MADDAAQPIASWTPPEVWLLRALLIDGIEVSASESFEVSERLRMRVVEGDEAALVADLPQHLGAEVWLRLAPYDRGHPWRMRWTVRVELEGEPSTVLSAARRTVRWTLGDARTVRVRAERSESVVRAEPPPRCEPIPAYDVAFNCHTLQSSAARSVEKGKSAGDWMVPTEEEAAPWWEVDTGRAHFVDQIGIQCHGPLRGRLEVRLFAYRDEQAGTDQGWSKSVELVDGRAVLDVGAVGRYLRVTLQPMGERASLSFGAVTVMAAPLADDSLLDGVRRSMTLFADRPLYAHRERNGGELGGYEHWLTYREVWDRSRALADGLAAELEQHGASEERIFVAVCARGRAEWPIVDIACILRGYVVIPVAHTDAPEKLATILDRTGVRAVVCSPDWVPHFAAMGERCPGLQLVVEMTPLADEQAAEEESGRLARVTLAELERRGVGRELPFVRRPGDDLYSVLFTSGSTGQPKGAMRSYDAFNAMLESYGCVQPAVHLSFQPFSHLSERMMAPVVVQHGGQIGFASGDPSRLFDDAAQLKPTFMGGVPRVFDVLRSRFNAAWATRRQERPDEDEQAARDEVLAATRALLGGRLQSVSVGSAKPSAALLEFMRECFAGVWVSEGYGSTEVGTIAIDGVIPSDVDVKLVDLPELGYASTDDPPRGEICVRTQHMIGGYFGDPQATSGQFDAEGYFRTGDIGARHPDGTIEVIGRRKNVVKLAQGEFVAPELIETALLHCALVDQIHVHADPLEVCVVAVVVPNVAALGAALDPTLDPTVHQASDWLTCDEARAIVRLALRETGRAHDLASFEIPAAVHLTAEPMTAESGLLTSSHKPNRRAIASHFADVLAALYDGAHHAAGGPATSLLEAVESVACSLVGRVDLDADLSAELGVDSLVGVQLVSVLEQRLRRPVPLAAWFAASSLRDFAARLEEGGGGAHSEARADMNRPLPFEAKTIAGRPAPDPRYSAVLLTGATGFLGRGLVESLLAKTDAVLHCLVRAGSDEEGQRRLFAHLEEGGVSLSDEHRRRVRVIAGDLAKPRLGLSDARWDELASGLDAILHAGALVNWIHRYDTLRHANVLGTLELLALAADTRTKAFHFVSTISTAPADGDERSMLDEQGAFRGSGYGLSKWIAERHVCAACEAGLPTVVYRPAMIAAHSTRGHSNPDDFGTRYVVGCAQLGLHLDVDGVLDMTPVDFVSDAIVALSADASAVGRVVHLANIEGSLSYRALGAAMRRAGVDVRPAAYAAFRDALVGVSKAEGCDVNALSPLIAYFPAAGFVMAMGPWPCRRSREALAALGVECPRVDDAMVGALVSRLRERGLLPATSATTLV